MRTVLAIDVGGSHVKLKRSSGEEVRRFASGSDLRAEQMATQAVALAADWEYDVVSIGVPSPVHAGRVVSEPVNLGGGWVGFDLEGAFGKPTMVVNDAAMQALGSYEGGTMLFLGLGTGLGSALVVDGIVESMELGHLPFRKATFEDYVGERGRRRLGGKKWRTAVGDAVDRLTAALEPDYVVLGGGNAKKLGELPANVRLGMNENAFVGGFRLWERLVEVSPSGPAIRPRSENRAKEDRSMKYMLLIHGGEGRGSFESLSEDDRRRVMDEYMAISRAPGVVAGDQLQPADTATTVRVDDGKTLTTDGPFVEAKEALGGYYLYEAPDLDAAIALAARIPAARMGGAVEVRPLVERGSR